MDVNGAWMMTHGNDFPKIFQWILLPMLASWHFGGSISIPAFSQELQRRNFRDPVASAA